MFYFIFKIGSICLPILDPIDSWKASIFLDDVLKALVEIIDHPDLIIPVNDGLNFFLFYFKINSAGLFFVDVANEYLYKKDEYDRKVLQMVQKNKISRV